MLLIVAPLALAAGPRAQQEVPQTQQMLAPDSTFTKEQWSFSHEDHKCPGLDQVNGRHPYKLAACLDDAWNVGLAVQVLHKAKFIENMNRWGPRADSNVQRRAVLHSAFTWKERHMPTASLTEQAPFNEALEELLQAFNATFFAKHTGTERMLFSHISKAGGTSFHDLAKANRVAMPEGEWSPQGGWFKGDGPTWCCDVPTELSCQDRIFQMDKYHNKLLLQERYLDANGGKDKPQLCDELVYAVMLRKPSDRIMSHLNMISNDYLKMDQPDNLLVSRLADVIEAGCTNATLVADAVYLDTTPEEIKRTAMTREFGQTLCGVASNYMTRSMLGTTTFGTHVYRSHFNDTVAEESVESAITVLESYSLVLLLEESAGDQSQLDLFKLTLGFNQSDLASHHERGTELHERRFVPKFLSPEQRRRLENLNRADLKLYERARLIFAQDLFFYSYAAGRNMSVPRWLDYSSDLHRR